jgi:nucleotide-binding universal stress UspA family protein
MAVIKKETEMKKLLVLTDFSSNAFHVEVAALSLSGKLSAGIILYHTIPYIPLIPSDGGGPYVTKTASMLFDDSKERLIQEADKLREVAVMRGCHVDIDEENGEGGLGEVITDLTGDPNIEMVIMGGRSGGALDHLLSGSDTAAVIRKAQKPVLIIPVKTEWNVPGKVVFATNFETADIPAVSFLQHLSVRLGFSLDIVHVIPKGKVPIEVGPEVAFRQYLVHHGLNYNQVRGEDVHRGLQHYCKKNGADLLAMTHGQHSFISRLFGHSESRAMISGQQLAVLVFPPCFK